TLSGTAMINNSNIGTPATTDGGQHWSITVSGLGSANGTLELNLANNTDIADLAGNSLATMTLSGQSYTLAQTASTLNSINRFSPSSQLTNASSITFQPPFTAAFPYTTLFRSTLSGMAMINSSNIGTPASTDGGVHWSIQVTGLGSANGTLELDLANNAGIADLASNPLSTMTLSGQSYTLDHVAPTVSISAPSSTFPTGASVTYTVTYSDTNFQSSMLTTANVHLNATSNVGGTLSFGNSTGATRIVTIYNLFGSGGTLGISIDAGSGMDQAGNVAPAAGPSTTFYVSTIYTGLKSISRFSPTGQFTNASSVTFQATFSGAVTGVAASNFKLTGTA